MPLLVVPVVQDGAHPALARLSLSAAAGVPLLIRTVQALLATATEQALGPIVVVCHRDLAPEVTSLLTRHRCAGVGTLSAFAGDETSLIAAGLRQLPDLPDRIAVLHPQYPSAPAASVATVLGGLRPGVDAVVTVEAVTETLKAVRPDDRIDATLPREGFARPVTPVAVHTAHLLRFAADQRRVGALPPAAGRSLAMAMAFTSGSVRLVHSPVPLQRADSELQAAVQGRDLPINGSA